MKLISGLLSLASLAACLAAPVVYFHGGMTEAAYKLSLIVASLVWFVAATTWATRKGESQ
jgi:hypothetical protein